MSSEIKIQMNRYNGTDYDILLPQCADNPNMIIADTAGEPADPNPLIADQLKVARKIGNADFDGTTNITLDQIGRGIVNGIAGLDANGKIEITQIPSHASTHAIGGSDLLTPEDIGAINKSDKATTTEVESGAVVDKYISPDVLKSEALLLSGGTMTGNINMNSHSILNLPTPTQTSEAVNKAYADSLISNLITSYAYSFFASYNDGNARNVVTGFMPKFTIILLKLSDSIIADEGWVGSSTLNNGVIIAKDNVNSIQYGGGSDFRYFAYSKNANGFTITPNVNYGKSAMFYCFAIR